MYAQLFGNYLIGNEIITNKQLVDAMELASKSSLGLEAKLIHAGLVSGKDVEAALVECKNFDFKLEDILVRDELVSNDTLLGLDGYDAPRYLILGQALVESGALTWSSFENALVDYQSDNEIFELDLDPTQKKEVAKLVETLFDVVQKPLTGDTVLYIELLFNNLSQYIGDDYTVLTPTNVPEYPLNYCVLQSLSGPLCINSYLDMEKDVALAFASRYTGEKYTEHNDYVSASVEDFLNLQNGLYIVNMSNDYNMELHLDPPFTSEDGVLLDDNDTFLLPVIYPFGQLNFLINVTYPDFSDIELF